MSIVTTFNNIPNTFSHFNNVNNINIFQNNNNNIITSYIPYSHNCPINFFPNNQKISSYSHPNIQINEIINKIPYNNNQNNINKNQIINTIEKSTNNNKIKKQESDADLIQDLTGNYLNKEEDILSEEKTDKKEVEINIGKIVVNDLILNNFPIINLNNRDKYNISLSENILNNDDFFTAIKEKKEDEKNGMNIEEEEKVVIPDKSILNIDENIFNDLKNLMNNEQKKLYANYKQLMLKKVIEIIYDKCLNLILEIKRNIKNRVKKSKSFDLSNSLHNIFKLHNELYNKYLVSLNKEPIEENTKEYFTYVEDYIQNSNGKTYKCEVCLKEFINFHKLGGHMSKMHPNCSEKYKKQNDIRKQREGNRKVLDFVKEKLFEKYNLNYRKMKKNDEKEKIKSFIKTHQKEYEILRRKIHRENALKNEE